MLICVFMESVSGFNHCLSYVANDQFDVIVFILQVQVQVYIEPM